MSNPVRTCLACSASDDHPRHVHVLQDGNEVTYHVDCCAQVRGCESCREQIKGLKKGSIGDAMRAHLTKNWES